MQKPASDMPHEVALFRFSIIADLLSLPVGSDITARIAQKATQVYLIPGTRRTRIAPETIRGWLRQYRDSGFAGLCPRPRGDRGKSRRLPAEAAQQLIRIKEKTPRLAVREVIRQAHASGSIAKEVTLAPSTVYRLLRQQGLMDRLGDQAPPQDRRRFAYRDAGELWMSDVMHGPTVGSDSNDQRRRSKTYLIAFIDDATRVIPQARFTFAESAEKFLPVLKQALIRRGIPLRLYVDNGANYRSRHLSLVCAKLGICLIHARPYQPAGKGKIERFFRTCRAQLLPVLGAADTGSLDAVNRRLWAWVEGEYHHTPHRGLDNHTPLDQWAFAAGKVRMVGPDIDLDALFRLEFKRRVNRDRTVSFKGTLYEVDAALVGQTVTLLQDPDAPRQRRLPVSHQGRAAGFATILDAYANTRVKRAGPGRQIEVGDPAPEPPASPIALSNLKQQKRPDPARQDQTGDSAKPEQDN